MSAILNAIFGTYPEQEETTAGSSTQSVVATNTVNGENLHTSAVADDVHVKSCISSETQASAAVHNPLDINALLAQLSTTHSQVDAYSQTRTAEINEQVQRAIGDVLAGTQQQQQALLLDANTRHLAIDNDYKTQLQKAVEALDANKAKLLADLERDLHGKQQAIMDEAKRQIDVLNDQANADKLHVLKEAQEQARQEIAHITDHVATSGQQETQHVLESTTTTTITSHAQAAGATETTATAPVTEPAVTANTAIDTQQQEVALHSAVNTQPLVEAPTNAVEAQQPVETVNNAVNTQQPVETPHNAVNTQQPVEAPCHAVDIQQQVETRTVSDAVVPVATPVPTADTTAIVDSTQEHSTVFGTVTGASELTTTPVDIIADAPTNNNVVATEIQSPPDNTTF